jgi:hypothetical protein
MASRGSGPRHPARRALQRARANGRRGTYGARCVISPNLHRIAMFRRLLAPSRTLAVAALLLGTHLAFAAEATTADTLYRQDRAACAHVGASQARSDCLREAGAARADARRGRLSSASEATLAANARQRCTVHADADSRLACERMVAGEGSHSGSVAAGGVLRSLTTAVTPAAASAPAAR